MSHYHQPLEVQVKSGTLLLNEAVRRTDILKCSRPFATRIADAPVFGVERSHSRTSQGLAQMTGMFEIVSCAPITAVNVQQKGVRTLRTWQTYFEKLIRVGAIHYARIGWRLRLAEDVFGEHGSLSG
jgi:hypothetical protein